MICEQDCRNPIDRRTRQEAAMSLKPIPLGILALALGICADAAPLPGVPSPADASAPTGASPQGNAAAPSDPSSQGKARPTPVQPDQPDQPGAIVIASPNLRNRGTTVASPDGALFGRLNLYGKERPLEQPPALKLAPDEAAKSGGAGNAGAPEPAHN
jgi:hypothetical protein